MYMIEHIIINIYQRVPELQQCALHDDKYIYVQYVYRDQDLARRHKIHICRTKSVCPENVLQTDNLP